MTPMDTFWPFARQMLRYRVTILVAMVGAVVSALCFGVGIMSVPLILNAMLGAEGKTLPVLLGELNLKVNGVIPQAWIDLLPTEAFPGVVLVLLAILALTSVGATAKFIHTYLAMSVAMRTVSNVRKAAFYRIVHMPMRTVVSEGTLDQISRVVRDTNQLRNGFVALMGKGIGETLKGVSALIAALILSWMLTLIALIATPVLVLTIRLFSQRIKGASKRALRQSSVLLSCITQTMFGLRVVKVHTAERFEVGRFNRVNRNLLDQELSMRQVKALASPVVDLITVTGIIFIAIVASWYILTFDVDATVAIGTLFALGAAGASLRPLTQIATDVHESAAAADRLTELLQIDVEESRDGDRQRLDEHRETISFVGVTLTYPNADQPALNGVDLTIDAGQTVAFVGPNGSGKTTLLSLVPRLFDPDGGAVMIDGVDIATVTLRSLRRQIGVVTQETVIFDDTIANNIAYGSSETEFASIEAAAKQAFAHEFIMQKPDGYDTLAGEQGAQLSGGQRQRIAIARAILRNPRILILDEATSMIDAESEALINDALSTFCHDRTSLVIAHRLSTVVNADRIVVLDRGQVVDVGTHRELLDRCGLYQQLCRTQLVGEETAG